MEYLEALEASGFSMWAKESSTAYVGFLAFHTIGLVFLAGISGAIAMRILGVARTMPLAPMIDFYPLMWAGLAINAFTGSVLMCLYPTKYLVDPTLYIKLAAVGVAVYMAVKLKAVLVSVNEGMESAAESPEAKKAAVGLLLSWFVALLTGRIMAYSLDTKLQTTAAVIVALCLLFGVGYLIGRRQGWIGSTE
ncbi:MAG TPA: hypothetical protein QF517_10005 [Pseudomonadales bacterium]|mgnify:FL=1|jgi:hypothetical protein|nr:hypothetical protein [Gammaproteobacteria bacterium]MDP6026130.1 hypothetical protein [Pseudomonadales bacterium]MDP6316102.1 hypothetical protein [Pseudomonadales bacterium]MDP7315572.1 hypothetical protein [Pseudomonadales bacterium]MDP7577622.1 hypothetical protein [Pseudomonadales bacterium]|tara:strand:- start:864 stop:1442 length:579 start_codon:yes stop_codon:yes gene_type:complete